MPLSVSEARRAVEEARAALRSTTDGRYAPAVVELFRQHLARAQNALVAAERAQRQARRAGSWPFRVVESGGKVLVTPSNLSHFETLPPEAR